MAAIKLKIKNKESAKKLQKILDNLTTFIKSKQLKKLLIGLLGIFIILASLDLGIFMYFKTQVLAYTNTGVIVTKKDAINRLLELPQYTQVTLQQLINDVTINQLVTFQAKKQKVTVSKEEINNRLKKNGQDPSKVDAQTLESLRVVMLMEKLAKVKEPTITDKQVKDFYDKNKSLYNLKKFDDKTKKQIKAYMRDQDVEAQIVKWLDGQIKDAGFVNLTNKQLKYKPLAGIKLFKICIKHLLAK